MFERLPYPVVVHVSSYLDKELFFIPQLNKRMRQEAKKKEFVHLTVLIAEKRFCYRLYDFREKQDNLFKATMSVQLGSPNLMIHAMKQLNVMHHTAVCESALKKTRALEYKAEELRKKRGPIRLPDSMTIEIE